nr:hypothetical protein [Tanacetum cinerariifolium]
RYAPASVDMKWRYAPPTKGYDLHGRYDSPLVGMLLPLKDMIYSGGPLHSNDNACPERSRCTGISETAVVE